MKNISLKIILLLTGFLFLTSCVLDQEKDDFGAGPSVVQFQRATESKSFVQKGTGEITDYNIVVQNFGGNNLPSTAPVTVTVAVAADSQLKEGPEFTIPNKTVTIPAGSNSANLLLKVNADKLVVGTSKKITLEIVSSSQVVSNGKQRITSTVRAICESKLAGEYVYTNGVKRDVTIKSTGTGAYEVSGDNAFGDPYYFNMTDNCGVLTIAGGQLQDSNGIALSGSGTVNKITGDITLSYTADGYFSNRPMLLKKK